MTKRIIASLAVLSALVAIIGVTIVILSSTASGSEHPPPRVHIGTAVKITRGVDDQQLAHRAVLQIRRRQVVVQRRRAHQAEIQRARASRSARRKPLGCTDSNWRSTMTADEIWIDTRESGMDPTPSDVNPSSGARGLGQLLPSTYADLGLNPDWDPCHELVAQRAYVRERYGTEDNAVAFWRTHSWY